METIEEKRGSPEGPGDLADYSISSLAWVGDAVFEVRIRTLLAREKRAGSGSLHQEAKRFVSARGQAVLMECLLEEACPFVLTGEEEGVLRRARNFHSTSQPKHVDLPDYRKATAFEALIGWLWLGGSEERALALIDYVLDQVRREEE